LNYPRKPIKSTPSTYSQQVRLIDQNGEMIGVVSLRDAQMMAQEKDLDLIEVSPDADPPVCKIGDYGRLRYHEQKKKNEMRKKQKIIVVKEVQLRPHIQEHDYQVKLSHARGFLEHKDKVKLILQFRGREITFADAGQKVVERMVADLAEWGKPESTPKLEGKRIIAVLVPTKSIARPTSSEKEDESAVPEDAV